MFIGNIPIPKTIMLMQIDKMSCGSISEICSENL